MQKGNVRSGLCCEHNRIEKRDMRNLCWRLTIHPNDMYLFILFDEIRMYENLLIWNPTEHKNFPFICKYLQLQITLFSLRICRLFYEAWFYNFLRWFGFWVPKGNWSSPMRVSISYCYSNPCFSSSCFFFFDNIKHDFHCANTCTLISSKPTDIGKHGFIIQSSLLSPIDRAGAPQQHIIIILANSWSMLLKEIIQSNLKAKHRN